MDVGSGFGRLEQAEQRQHHDEVDEVPGRQHAREQHVVAFGRFEPSQPSRMQVATNSQKNCLYSGRYFADFTLDRRATAGTNRMPIEPNSAMTPASLFGIERRIA